MKVALNEISQSAIFLTAGNCIYLFLSSMPWMGLLKSSYPIAFTLVVL